jgi:hypothetical protein
MLDADAALPLSSVLNNLPGITPAIRQELTEAITTATE